MCLGLVLSAPGRPASDPGCPASPPFAPRAPPPRGPLPDRGPQILRPHTRLHHAPTARHGSSGAAPVPELIRPRSRPRSGQDQSPTARHADQDPRDPFSTRGDGSSPPPPLFKTPTDHDRSSIPSTSASPGSRTRPILEGFSPAGNGFLQAVSLNKTTPEQAPPPPPPIGPSRDPEATPGLP